MLHIKMAGAVFAKPSSKIEKDFEAKASVENTEMNVEEVISGHSIVDLDGEEEVQVELQDEKEDEEQDEDVEGEEEDEEEDEEDISF